MPLNLPSVASIEQLFEDMQPTDLGGQPFIPALHPSDLVASDEQPSAPEDELEAEELDEAALGPFTSFVASDVPLAMVAVDAGVLEVGVCRTGYALAFKAAVISQDANGHLSANVIGPRVKFITPTNRAELLRYVGQCLMDPTLFIEEYADGTISIKAGAREPNQFKDRLRNFIERMLQLDVAQELVSGVLLVDGSLTLRTYNTPQIFLEALARQAQTRNNDIIGVSKKSRITVDGVHISALLDDIPASDSGFRKIVRLDTEDDAEERNLGSPFATRFAPAGYTFRVDVARRSLLASEEDVLQAFYANTQMMLGYPNLLRLAHIHSAFTKSEIVALQVQAAHDFNVSMRAPEDVSVIFAPFRKGIGG